MLMTEHNLCFYQALMQRLRDAIARAALAAFARRRFARAIAGARDLEHVFHTAPLICWSAPFRWRQ